MKPNLPSWESAASSDSGYDPAPVSITPGSRKAVRYGETKERELTMLNIIERHGRHYLCWETHNHDSPGQTVCELRDYRRANRAAIIKVAQDAADKPTRAEMLALMRAAIRKAGY